MTPCGSTTRSGEQRLVVRSYSYAMRDEPPTMSHFFSPLESGSLPWTLEASPLSDYGR